MRLHTKKYLVDDERFSSQIESYFFSDESVDVVDDEDDGHI
jgi:hypothetical protein